MKIFKKKEQEKWYSYDAIDSTNCVYRMIIGQRSNGKTYGAMKKVIDEFLSSGKPSGYIRRYNDDIAPKALNLLFFPHNKYIDKKTKGKYNSTEYKTNTFRLVKRDASGAILAKSDPILYTAAMNNWERFKGQDRGDIAYLIFDEFLTRSNYLKDEFATFANIISSFVRGRQGCIIYMLANTVSKYAPYFEEMGLNEIDKIKQGQIAVFSYNNDKLSVAVEYCLQSEATKDVEYYYAFDNPQLDMISHGGWEEAMYPRLPEDTIMRPEDMLFKALLEFNYKKIVIEVYHYGIELFAYVHPLGKSKYQWRDDDVKFSDILSSSRWVCNTWSKPITPKHQLIKECYNSKHFFYSDNTTGEIMRNYTLNCL